MPTAHDKPGLCYRKYTGCEPFDDDDCRDCGYVNDWPEDWDQTVESYEDSDRDEFD